MTTNTDSFDFSLNLKPVAATSADRPKRWMAPPFKAYPLNAEAALVQIEGQYPPIRLNLQLVQLLNLCNEFRTLDQHVAHICTQLGVPSAQRGAIKEALEHLQGQSALLEEDALMAKLAQQGKPLADPPGLAHCFVRTANRPAALERLLQNIQQKTSMSVPTVWILDDSSASEEAAQNEQIAKDFAAQWSGPCHYIDRKRRSDLISHIAKRSGADHLHLRWLIEGDEDDPQPTYGATLNTALLLAAGQRFCIIDDDATLDAHTLEGAHQGIDLRSKWQHRMEFVDPSTPERSQFPKASIDALAAHAQWLGRSLSEVTKDLLDQPNDFLGKVDAQMVHQLNGQPSVRLTTNGTLGDPGTSGMAWIFAQPAKDLHALCHEDPNWAERIFNRRFARSSLGVQITNDFSLMTTTLTGVDNRELLLPTASKGRNEDLLFGALIRFLYPDALTVSLPFMLPHRPEEPRRWLDEELDQKKPLDQRHNHAMLLADLIEGLDLPKGDIGARRRYLAAWLTQFSKMGEAETKALIMNYITELQAEQVKAINETASDLEAPDWLKQLFARVIHHALATDELADENLQKLAKPIQHFAGRYAETLDAWVDAWRWCCQHDMAHELP